MKAINGELKDANFFRLMQNVKNRCESLHVVVKHENLVYFISIHFEDIFGVLDEDTEYYIDIVAEDEEGRQSRITTYFAHSHLKDYEVVAKLEGFKHFICG